MGLRDREGWRGKEEVCHSTKEITPVEPICNYKLILGIHLSFIHLLESS